jgi:hypothetical protein
MSAEFFRAQAALCFRIARATPQEHIAWEILSLATEYESKASELEIVAVPTPNAHGSNDGCAPDDPKIREVTIVV